jgi:hypothetical protein
VVSDGEANKAWSAYVAVGPAADSFDARRANVLVISDEGVGADARRRILSALAALPETRRQGRDTPSVVTLKVG